MNDFSGLMWTILQKYEVLYLAVFVRLHFKNRILFATKISHEKHIMCMQAKGDTILAKADKLGNQDTHKMSPLAKTFFFKRIY